MACRHLPRQVRIYQASGGYMCTNCGRIVSAEAASKGLRSRQRGNAKEREWAKRMGMARTGQFGGKDDGLSFNGMFAGQAKSFATGRFPGWISKELESLRAAKPDRVPVLGIIESPGSGRRGRSLVVVTEADWVSLLVGSGS